MPDRYLTRMIELRPLHEGLQEFINDNCPSNYKLHSVVPVHRSQHGTSYFIVVFEQREFGNAG